jgi:plastocyanin
MSPGGFGISSATIAKGSKLLLVDDTTEQHVLANGTWQQNTPVQKREPGAPLVSNLSLSGNSVTIGPFATAGTYHILCLLHRGMNLTINVQ